MSIRLPNYFSCVSRTVVVETPRINLRPFAQQGVPEEILSQLAVRRFLLTVSEVVSTVNAEESISFSETFIKVPVICCGSPYLFPVAAWVSHEYSLIRGYILGYHKYYAAGPSDIDRAVLATDDITVDLRPRRFTDMDEEDLPEEQSREMLLWTNFDLNGARSQGYARISVRNYERKSLRRIELSKPVGGILGVPLDAVAAYEIQDSFDVVGTKPI